MLSALASRKHRRSRRLDGDDERVEASSLRKRPTPLIVPPVPDPYTNASMRPSIRDHSSGAVVS